MWSYEDTIALINCVETHYDELHHPSKRKHIWATISTELGSLNVNVCNNKHTDNSQNNISFILWQKRKVLFLITI